MKGICRIKNVILLALLAFVPQLAAAADVKVSAEVRAAYVGEDQPIEVIVTVVRDASMDVDLSSFRLSNDLVTVEHLGDATQTSLTIINGRRTEKSVVISRYRFYIPGRVSGLYVLPPVVVMVDGLFVQSPSVSYEVQVSEARQDFRLEVSVEGALPLFPGRKVKFVYRIYFKDNIELTVEQLPLLKAEGFRKVGEKTVSSFTDNGVNVHEIVQEVEAVKPGVYIFGESVIEGFAYQEDFFGRRTYKKPRLKAVAKAVTITVEGFPDEGKPDTFSGAVGDFELKVEMLTPDVVNAGDKIELSVVIKGPGEFSTVQLADVRYQKGFQGQFRFSDLPPVGEVKGNAKTYVVELRPLSENVKAIPAIEFSYFDPVIRRYRVLRSEPIAITVKAMAAPIPQPVTENVATPVGDDVEKHGGTGDDWREALRVPKAIEIAGCYEVAAAQLVVYPWQTWKALWIVPLGAALLAIQAWLQRFRRRRHDRQRAVNSRYYLDQAIKSGGDVAQRYSLIEEALLLRMVENGSIAATMPPEDLPSDGIAGEVRTFLLSLEERRFAGMEDSFDDAVIEAARNLFERIL